jgi:hypothetical protein
VRAGKARPRHDTRVISTSEIKVVVIVEVCRDCGLAEVRTNPPLLGPQRKHLCQRLRT